MIKIKSDKIIVGESLFSGYLYIDGDKISSVSADDLPCDEFYDFTGSYVSPGFIETHSHGAGGYAYTYSSVDDVIKACNFHAKHGVTTICPTSSAAPFDIMKEAVKNVYLAKKSGKVIPNLLGAHLEGPYFSQKQAGAQCPTFITPPIKKDYESLISEYGDCIVRWSYAPENDKDGEFCKYLTEHNVIASAGHTNATYSDMDLAISNGCNLVTHLYSCTSTVTRDHGFRILGVIETAFLRDELFVELICDGKHLPPELINMIIKIKGTDKVILTTDSSYVAGSDIKEGNLTGTPFIVEDGVCKLLDRSAFAASCATANDLIRTLKNGCKISIPTAVKMLTETPAKLFKLNKGSLKKGYDADVIVFDEDINVSSVFVNGIKV